MIVIKDTLILPSQNNVPKDTVSIIKSIYSDSLKIGKTIVTQTYPLLPYIFFDSASSELKPNYIKSYPTEKFNELYLPKETLGIYYSILDIIGYRLNKNDKAKLTILGVTDGEEIADEKSRMELAEKRANSIAYYLKAKWKIADDRLIVKSEDTPKLPTSKSYNEGYQENRRVELSSDDPLVLEPVIHLKFWEHTADKNDLIIKSEFNRNPAIKSWNILLQDKNGNLLRQLTGAEEYPPSSISLNLFSDLISKIAESVEGIDTIFAVLNINLVDGNVESKKTAILVNKKQNQFEIGRLNLIVFDFDKFDISEANRKMLVNFINSAIQKNSTTRITGSTDILGEENYNIKLSNDRANSVRNYLRNIKPDVKVSEVIGTGSKNLLYDNNLPEGRFYCRTVLIEVSTPLE
jgi:outer membrane protein OmpA-like peptidoglycan-associated protein